MIEVPAALKEKVSREGLWVFAYGSLMWRPNFPHRQMEPARLFGYHRSLCIYSTAYRGTYERPGLVFGLNTGGSCQGLAINVAPEHVDETMRYLYEREMITRVYVPKWLPVHFNNRPPSKKTEVNWVFVADRDHEQYTGRISIDEQVTLVKQGCGKAGPCIDYLRSTLEHLHSLGIRDRSLETVVRRVDTDD